MEWISRNEIFRMSSTKTDSPLRQGMHLTDAVTLSPVAFSTDAEILELREQLKVIRELKENRLSMLGLKELSSNAS